MAARVRSLEFSRIGPRELSRPTRRGGVPPPRARGRGAFVTVPCSTWRHRAPSAHLPARRVSSQAARHAGCVSTEDDPPAFALPRSHLLSLPPPLCPSLYAPNVDLRRRDSCTRRRAARLFLQGTPRTDDTGTPPPPPEPNAPHPGLSRALPPPANESVRAPPSGDPEPRSAVPSTRRHVSQLPRARLESWLAEGV
ncbi:hypothetical protein SCP_0500100 [Sparassis crispa]|uniref:Uncharacterized protein n=1 Tax=Sparassis crispa TaxID=139825 RepID=A0A401GLB8_9APHY|nr:hypothetical protein SCP_0500100 [Sparassis crispa]GBE82967.1 hypothetical protein SCP_0500100 [Sparassis crispa]